MTDYILIMKWVDAAGRKKIYYQAFETAIDAENARDMYAPLFNKMVEYGTLQCYSIEIR